MSIEVKQFNLLAWVLGVCVVVYLGGAVFALATGAIKFVDFAAAVGVPLGPMVGWAARGAAVSK